MTLVEAAAVIRHAVGVGPVPAVYVVGEPVAVVVDVVAGDLTGVDPDVRRKVGMGEVGSGVDVGDDHRWAPGRQVPGRRRVDVGPGLALGAEQALAGVSQRPLVTEQGIVGDHPVIDVLVGLGLRHPGQSRRLQRREAGALRAWDREQAEVRGAEPALQAGTDSVSCRPFRRPAEMGGEANDHLAGDQAMRSQGCRGRRGPGPQPEDSSDQDMAPPRPKLMAGA